MPEPLEATISLDIEEARSRVADLASELSDALQTAGQVTLTADTGEIAGAVSAAIGDSQTVAVEADVAAAEAEVGAFKQQAEANPPVIAIEADTAAAEAAVSDLDGAISDAGGSASSAEGSVHGFGESAALAGGAAALARGEVGGLGELTEGAGLASAGAVAGVAALGASVFELAQKGVEAVSAEQRFNAIVGETADQVEKVHVGSLTADLGKLGLQFGSTDSDMKNTASTLFQFATNSGAGREEAAKFTDQVVALSARAVSLNPALGNLGDVADSLGVKIARGGRFAASYGIALTAAEINARALDNTQKAAAGDLTIYEKATAATQLAVEKYGSSLGTTVAEGAKNAANQQKSLHAELSQMLEEVGKPLVTPLFDAIRTSLPDVVAIAKPLGQIGIAILPAIAAAAGLAAPPLQLIADALGDVPTPALTAAAVVGALAFGVSALGAAEYGTATASIVAANAVAFFSEEVTFASLSLSTAIPLLGAFVAGVAIGKEIFSHLGIGPRDFGKALDEEGKAAQAAAKANGDDLPKAFKRLEQAAHDAQNGGASPLLDKLRAFRDLAEIDTDKAAKFANSQDHTSDAFKGMVGVLNSVIGKRNADAAAAAAESDATKNVATQVDISTDSFQAASAEFGFYAAAAASASGLTTQSLDDISKHAADLDKSTASAFNSATSIVSRFGTATSVSVDDIIGALNESVGAAQRWSINLTTLAHSTIDQGLIEELRQAGPKAEPLIEGLLQAVASGNLETINNAESSLRTLLANTNADLDAMELQAAIHMSNIQAVVEARAADIESGGTSHLDALRTKGDQDLADLAVAAETQMGRVGAAINSLPDLHPITIPITIDVATNSQVIGAGLPDVGGVETYIQQLALQQYLASREGRAAGGPVEAGESYIVGENGPELFTATTDGTITPNDSGGVLDSLSRAFISTDVLAAAKRMLDEGLAGTLKEAYDQLRTYATSWHEDGSFGSPFTDLFKAYDAQNAADGIEGLARGGAVVPGTPYIVGENGPELFEPTTAGRIYPTGAASRSAPTFSGASVVTPTVVIASAEGTGRSGDTFHIEKMVLEQATPNPTREALQSVHILRRAATMSRASR